MSNKALDWALDLPITGPAKGVLVALANSKNQATGKCFPSVPRLILHSGYCARSVTNGLKELEKNGLITVNRSIGKSNHYTLNQCTTCSSAGDAVVQEMPYTPAGDAVHPSTTCSTPPQEMHPNQKEPEVNQKLTRTSCPKFSDDDFLFAEFMWGKIQLLTKANKAPNLESWAKTIRLLREVDKREGQLIYEVFVWANSDSFWATNILSADKLRKQFGVLTAKMNQTALSTQKPDYSQMARDVADPFERKEITHERH